MKICIMKVGGVIAPHVVAGYERAAMRLGHQAAVAMAYTDQNKLGQVLLQVSAWQPDLVITYGHGLLWPNEQGPFFRRTNTKVAMLHYDCPFYVLTQDKLDEYLAHPDAYFHFVWDRAYLEEYKRLGIKNVFPIMLATDPHLFQPIECEATRDLMFVGSFANPETLRAARIAKLTPAQNAIVDHAIDQKVAHSSDTFLEILARANFENDPALTPNWIDRTWVSLHLAMHAEGSSTTRYACIHNLHGVTPHVYSGDPKAVTPSAIFEGPIDYETQLAAAYCGSKINLNITSFQLERSINNRIFDLGATRSFVLTDHREDLLNVWSGFDAVTYHSQDQLNDRIEHFLTRDNERREIAGALHNEVLSKHTYDHRVQYVIDTVTGA